MKRQQLRVFILFGLVILLMGGCSKEQPLSEIVSKISTEKTKDASGNEKEIAEVAGEYSGELYEVIENNQPEFSKEEKKNTQAFENYSSLDSLGRCGVAFANICKETMPKKKRGVIGQIKPSGWHTVKYNIVDGKYLYNRCHLIGYQLTGENANEENLITGTRYFNVEGMLPFEDEVADYVEQTDNHVLYRVTPVYDKDALVASGVQMEGYSVEDKGKGICFNVFVHNVQPGVQIDYETGESELNDEQGKDVFLQNENTVQEKGLSLQNEKDITFIINKNTRKFHKPNCSSVEETLPKNRKSFRGSQNELIEQGYVACGRCKP